MVWISLQDDVKRSFDNVKDDILNLKRGVNRELLVIEEISGRLQSFVAKEEFYSFVKRLGERLDRIDENLDAYLGYEDDIKGVDARVKNLGKKLSRQEDLSEEVKEVRALRGKLAAVEGAALSAQKFNEYAGKVSSDISSVRASMLTAKSLEGLKERLSGAEKKVDALEKAVPSKDDVSSVISSVEGLRESVRRVELDSQKKAGEIEKAAAKRIEDVDGNLRAEVEGIKASSVIRSDFERTVKDLKKEAASIRDVLERSVSEVDFSDYVTKKELLKKLAALEEMNSDIRKVAQDNAELEGSLESLQRETASLDDVKRIGADVKEVSRSLDSLRVVIEKAADSNQKRFSHEIEQARARFEKEISRLRDDFGSKIERMERERAERASAKAGEGIVSRIGRGFADFFKEEEEKEVKFRAKPSPSVSELLKEEEKKKSKKGPGVGRFVMPVLMTAVVVALFLLVFWLANRDAGVSGEIGGGGDNASNVSDVVEALPSAEDVVVNDSLEDAADLAASPGTLEYCMQEYECKERGDGRYWFGCYLDEEGTCRCFVTDAEGCGVPEKKAEEVPEVVKDGKRRAGYIVASLIVFAVFLAAYFFVLRRSEPGEKKQRKAKEKEKEKEEDGNGVDLDEFFQKK